MDGTIGSINTILETLITNFNTLLDCPARFAGEFNEQKIHCFVEYIEYYKRIKCIKDEQALQELQYLLVDHAYNWWMRRKGNIETWSEALTLLENQYSKKRPANKIYEEILRQPYENYQSKCDFIDDKMELFTELSQPELTESNKLAIIYALLPKDIQSQIELEGITSVKDLKKQLKLIKSVIDGVQIDQAHAVLSSRTTSDLCVDPAESENVSTTNKELLCKEINSQIPLENDIDGDSAREPVIKVRRTQDLMPRDDIKEEDESQYKITSNETNPSDANSTLHTSHENFQIDIDIMNQINNIIDETEMCIEAINSKESTSPTLSQTSNSAITLEFLGFQIKAAQPNNNGKSLLNSTKKNKKKRCMYCRNSNHTAQFCTKRAKHVKLFPERFEQAKLGENNNALNEASTGESSEISRNNISGNNSTFSNTQTTEMGVTMSNINPTSNITSSTDPCSGFASSAILNNVPERSINSTLTTKLIPAINGRAQNKVLATKLRNTDSPSPKCHQCGTLGFYKSICPNCSPIYSNNSHK